MLQFSATLVEKKTFPGDVFLLRFTPPQNTAFTFIPGQYVILTVPQAPEPVKRLYSIASAPNPAYFELLIKLVPGGAASSYIGSLAVGSSVEVQGPAGVFTLQNNPRSKVFLVTGTGYAPIRSFILSTPHHTENYYLYWGMQKAQDVVLLDELKTLSLQNPLFHPKICLSREATFDAIAPNDQPYFSLGRINNALQTLISSQPPNSLEFYICGRREVTESMREYLYNQKIAKELVFFERY